MTKPESACHVLCFGEALWDVLPDERLPGGAPMNVALRLSRLSVKAGLLSRVGEDADGQALRRYLEEAGLPTTYLQTDRQHATGSVHVDLSDAAEARYEIGDPAAWDFIDADAYFALEPPPFDALVFGSLAARHPASRRSLERLLREPAIRIFDVNFRPPYVSRPVVEQLLQAADWAKLNEDELHEICAWLGVDGQPADLLRAVRKRYALELVCATFGGDGVLLDDGVEIVEQPAFAVEVIDTVGCGDAFLGAFIAARFSGLGNSPAVRRAAAAAAIVAASEGANPAFSGADVDDLLRRM